MQSAECLLVFGIFTMLMIEAVYFGSYAIAISAYAIQKQ
jgi:hypothetical protein